MVSPFYTRIKTCQSRKIRSIHGIEQLEKKTASISGGRPISPMQSVLV